MTAEWLAALVAILAAIFTGWQAWEARRSRRDAHKSADDAQQHEQRAVAASERIAAAIEEQNATARAEREAYENPWRMIPQHVKSGRSYKFHLGGSEVVSDVRIQIDDAHMTTGKFRFVKPETERMRPGESMTLNWWRSMASAPQITAELFWTRPNGQEHSSAITLD